MQSDVSNYSLTIIRISGYICKREDVKGNGCCKTNVEPTTRYSCEKCHNASGCCSVYENCISCCMHPLNVRHHPKTVVLIVILGTIASH